MHNPSEPLRLKREGMALYLASGYGPSAAYSSAGYKFKSRSHLSKNAATLAANPEIKSRVHWLKDRPQEAASLLAGWNARRNEAEARERSQALNEAVAKRQAAIAGREVETCPAAPVSSNDEATLLGLLHHCQDEAKAIYERAKLERADAYVIKASLTAHRDFTLALQRYRDDAKQAGSEAGSCDTSSALALYSNMCATVGKPAPTLRVEDEPVFASASEKEVSHDETELRFNVTATLNQYDLLSAETPPDMRAQLQLLDVLAKSTQRLITLQARRRAQDDVRVRAGSTEFLIEPHVVLRWVEETKIA